MIFIIVFITHLRERKLWFQNFSNGAYTSWDIHIMIHNGCKLGYQTIIKEFDSHWVPHFSCLVKNMIIILNELEVSSSLMIMKLGKQTTDNDFASHWALHTLDFMLNIVKLSKWQLYQWSSLALGIVNHFFHTEDKSKIEIDKMFLEVCPYVCLCVLMGCWGWKG